MVNTPVQRGECEIERETYLERIQPARHRGHLLGYSHALWLAATKTGGMGRIHGLTLRQRLYATLPALRPLRQILTDRPGEGSAN
jgi:hypothetical protein